MGLHWQTHDLGIIESQSLFGRVANRATGDPPERKTAAPIDEIGSGGKNEDGKAGALFQVDFSNTDPDTATVGRIIATHYGIGGDL